MEVLVGHSGAARLRAEILGRFAGLLASAEGSTQILEHLAGAAVDPLGARGAVVLELVEPGAARVVAIRGVAPPRDATASDPAVNIEASGPALGREVLSLVGRPDWHAGTLLLVVRGELKGALVLLHEAPADLDEETLELAESLVHVAVAVLAHAYDHEKLRVATEAREGADEAPRQMELQRETLRALGRMASNLSHDLKNVVAPVIMHLDLLKRRETYDPAMLRQSFEAMDRVLRRGIDTIERLRSFGRQRLVNERELVDPGALVREALALVEPRVAETGLVLETSLARTPPARIQARDLVTALERVLSNACDAMSEGGTLTVATGTADDGGVFVEVRDTGVGMPPEVEAHVFEPFFTTKGAGGEGLGLSMVYAFVQRNGGDITLRTTPGEGTSFRLWFPAAPARAELVAERD